MIKKPKKCCAMGSYECQVPMPINGGVLSLYSNVEIPGIPTKDHDAIIEISKTRIVNSDPA